MKGKPTLPFYPPFWAHLERVLPLRTWSVSGGADNGGVHVPAGSWVPLFPMRVREPWGGQLAKAESGHQNRVAT